ncbi:glycosyltransferase family 4 protein [bacterium]|nr:glycosyltransferase family 4 protein [bacterium]
MNILHLRASNFYGGPERQLHQHARQALNSDYALTISSFLEEGRSPEFLEQIRADGIDTHIFEIGSAYDPSTVKMVRGYLRENEIDILCTHDYRTHVVGLAATRGLRTAWVAFSRGWTWENFKVKAYHTLDKIVIRFADHIVAVSGAQKQKLVKIMVPGSKISVAYNSIQPELFDDVEKVDLHKRFDFPDNAVIAVSGGRFSPEKGQMDMIEAAHRAIMHDEHLRFVLFGGGPDLAAAMHRIADLKRERYIVCPGHEKNLIGCIKGADMLLNPSLSEGLPNIVLEGMALRVPVIATDVGGVPELIENGVSGVLTPPSDPAALAAAILRMAGDTELQRRIAETALETIRTTFSFERQMADLSRVYDSLTRKSH